MTTRLPSDEPLHQGDDEVQMATTQKKDAELRMYKASVGCLLLVVVGLIVGLVVVSLRKKPASSLQNSHAGNLWANTDTEFGILQLSDLHYYPYYNASCSCRSYCSCRASTWGWSDCGGGYVREISRNPAQYGRGGCDPSGPLVTASIQKAQNIMSSFNTKYVIVTGDLIGHGLDAFLPVPSPFEPFVQQSYGFAFDQISAMTSKPIFPSLGNNDALYDYRNPSGSLLTYFASKFETVIQRNAGSYIRSNLTALSTGLFYMVQPETNLYVIALNTNLATWKVNTSDASLMALSARQLSFLSEQLTLIETVYGCPTASCAVIITGHIPPVLDNFSQYPQWHDATQARYESIVTSSNLQLIHLFGHTHTNTLHRVANKLVMVAPSISPIFTKTNPSFRQYSMSKESMSIMNFRDISMDLAMSNLYNQDLWFQKNFRETMQYHGIMSFQSGPNGGQTLGELMSNAWIQNPLSADYVNGVYGNWVSPDLRVKYVLCYNQTTTAGLRACIDGHNYTDLGR